MAENITFFESTAEDADDLLKEVSKLKPDTILLEESSPLSTAACLVHVLRTTPERKVVVVSQERNLMHLVHWHTVEVESATDLIESIMRV